MDGQQVVPHNGDVALDREAGRPNVQERARRDVLLDKLNHVSHLRPGRLLPEDEGARLIYLIDPLRLVHIRGRVRVYPHLVAEVIRVPHIVDHMHRVRGIEVACGVADRSEYDGPVLVGGQSAPTLVVGNKGVPCGPGHPVGRDVPPLDGARIRNGDREVPRRRQLVPVGDKHLGVRRHPLVRAAGRATLQHVARGAGEEPDLLPVPVVTGDLGIRVRGVGRIVVHVVPVVVVDRDAVHGKHGVILVGRGGSTVPIEPREVADPPVVIAAVDGDVRAANIRSAGRRRPDRGHALIPRAENDGHNLLARGPRGGLDADIQGLVDGAVPLVLGEQHRGAEH